MGRNHIRSKLYAELNTLLAHRCGVTFEDYGIIDVNGRSLGRYQSKYVPLRRCVLHNDECIDGVLLFGDGAIEFHDANSEDAYACGDYPNHIVKEVVDNLRAYE